MKSCVYLTLALIAGLDVGYTQVLKEPSVTAYVGNQTVLNHCKKWNGELYSSADSTTRDRFFLERDQDNFLSTLINLTKFAAKNQKVKEVVNEIENKRPEFKKNNAKIFFTVGKFDYYKTKSVYALRVGLINGGQPKDSIPQVYIKCINHKSYEISDKPFPGAVFNNADARVRLSVDAIKGAYSFLEFSASENLPSEDEIIERILLALENLDKKIPISLGDDLELSYKNDLDELNET